jgi:hypothetical protein
MLFSPVYIEAHPRRSAAFASRMNLRDAAQSISSKSFISFASNRLRTLLRNGRTPTPLLPIVCGLFPSQWGCIPLPSSSSSTYFFLLYPEIGRMPESFDPAGETHAFHQSRVTNHESRSLCTQPLDQLTTSNRFGQTAVGLPYALAQLSNRRQSKHVGGLR